ncbi:MAG: cyclic nucleotide-binding domain-containing protein [Chloroflexi bacterium]|nr:cyclic nucleotide-binding domain-containing protein [Chloroflexota bacterium]
MGVNATYEFLCKVPLFANLPEKDLLHICESTLDVFLEPEEVLFKEGDIGEHAYVVEEGEMEVLKTSTGADVLLAILGEGEVIGEMALVEDAPRNATLRSRSKSKVLQIPKSEMDFVLDTSPAAARAMFSNVLQRWRTTESALRQNEKMAQLGTLSAGVAHELNNPAAAVRRGAEQLAESIASFSEAQGAVAKVDFSPEQQSSLEQLMAIASDNATGVIGISSLDRSDLEYEFENLLEESGVEDGWQLAPALVDMGISAEVLRGAITQFEANQIGPVIQAMRARHEVQSLLHEIAEGSSRVSEIVKALKSYSYLDQAPVQEVDVHDGLNDTLVILRSKLRGIEVITDFASDLPLIQGYGSELNQVWTNLIDNAADALDGDGQVKIKTLPLDGAIQVRITDNGSGIPAEIQTRIFDAFFTTKPPGKGTGLGLDISHNIIVVKHRGKLELESRPGETTFSITLPLNFEEV